MAPWVLILATLLPAVAAARPPRDPSRVGPGDLLVATEGGGHRVSVQRLRLQDGAEAHVVAQDVVSLEGPVDALSASSDGRWLAAGLSDGGAAQVQLWDLRGPAPTLWWQSPDGCREPALEPTGRSLALTCPGAGAEPDGILSFDLGSRRTLRYVGEWPRSLPAWDGDGVLHWVEASPESSAVMRREGGGAFPIHRVRDAVSGLWSQGDGSWLLELAVPGARREFLRLLRAGDQRPESLLGGQWPPVERGDPVAVGRAGDIVLAHCGRSASQILRAVSGADLPPISLPGEAQALTIVPGWPAPSRQDLATAGPGALQAARADDVRVFGVGLGMALESAWSQLDRGGRHPFWIPPRSGRRPSGIGVGPGASGWCVEYGADDHGVIVDVRVRGCAGRLLSPAMSPLFELTAREGALLDRARRWLGPGVAAWIDSDEGDQAGQRPLIRRVRAEWSAPDRGLSLEVQVELLEGARHPLSGDVSLRLTEPIRPRVAGP
jgi:hypothetical protein